MARFCLTVSRLCLAGWVGIASFFVVVLLSLRGSPLFTEEAKLAHPKILFPLFYGFEFWLLGIALGTGFLAARQPDFRSFARGLALALLTLALLVGVADYFVVYRPLRDMIERAVRPPEFATLHEWSRWVNMADLALCATAAALLLWPEKAGNRGNAP